MNVSIFEITQERKELASCGSHYSVAYYLQGYCADMGGCKRILYISHTHPHPYFMRVCKDNKTMEKLDDL
jgi:hypothetical protein